jgi:hypothetical protein
VTIAHGDNTMRGEYGVVDMEKGMSRLLPRPASLADAGRGRVQGYLVPRKKDQPADAAAPAPVQKPAPAGADPR